jgi:hypothetical protein
MFAGALLYAIRFHVLGYYRRSDALERPENAEFDG